jgi:hypothetical protein
MKQKLKQTRPDRMVSALCHRGSHEGNEGKITCKGRSCTCNCHPINKKTPFCIVCEARRTDKEDGVCRYCSGERSLY